MYRFVLICFVVMFAIPATDANARRWFSWRNTPTNNVQQQRTLTGSDQQKCQQKAQIMASRRRMSHGVAPLIGHFEGIGYGNSRNCSTCTPRSRMTLTGDGAAQASNGQWYRCRSWR